MTIATDPVDRAEIDSAGGNSAALPLAQSVNGWNGGDFLEHDKLNAVTRNAALWKEWLDQTRANTEQLGFSSTFRTSSTNFGYGVGVGLVARQVQDDSHLVVTGKYVVLTLARLLRYQPTIHTHTFTASMTHHFYIDAGGVIVVSVVALGTPAAPGVGFVTLHSVDTDGAGISAETPGSAFSLPVIRMSTPLEIATTLTVLAPVLFNGGDITIDKIDALARSMNWIVAGDATRGWRFTHTAAERMQIREMVAGVATTILDLGAVGVAATLSRPLDITNAELVNAALLVRTTVVGGSGSRFVGPGGSFTPAAAIVTIDAPGTSVPLVLIPTTTGFAGGDVKGSIKLDNSAESNIIYKDNNNVTRTVWATQTGPSVNSAYTLANVNNFGVGTVAQSFNYTFVAGQRYLIKMGCRVGRFTGSTRDALFTCTVGGVALAFSGQTLLLWQGGGATELEQRFEDEVVFTAGGSGSLAVQLLVTPVNGAGNLNMAARSCRVLGHFD